MGKKDQPAQDYTGDEHWGKGGQFVIDPKSGKRVPAEKYQPDTVNNSSKELKDVD